MADILYGAHDWADDPNWSDTGAPNVAAYRHWAVRWCGIACLRMVLLARDDAAPSLYELAIGAKEYGAYSDAEGDPHGLIYRPFVEYVGAEHGLHAEVATEFAVTELYRHVQAGNLVIASVHPEIRRPHLPSPGQGGHLVLVIHADAGTVTFNDPSGHHADAMVVTLPITTFNKFYARRGIIIRP